MKPFDLEKAKAGDPLITRDGRKARFIAHVPEARESGRLLVLIESGKDVLPYYENGNFVQDAPRPADLFMAPKKRTVYVNLYLQPYAKVEGYVYSTKECAEEGSNSLKTDAIAVPIEIEE